VVYTGYNAWGYKGDFPVKFLKSPFSAQFATQNKCTSVFWGIVLNLDAGLSRADPCVGGWNFSKGTYIVMTFYVENSVASWVLRISTRRWRRIESCLFVRTLFRRRKFLKSLTHSHSAWWIEWRAEFWEVLSDVETEQNRAYSCIQSEHFSKVRSTEI